MHRLRWLFLLLLLAAAIGLTHALWRRASQPQPPESFGALRSPLVGCPSMMGTYLWPPEAGPHTDALRRNELAWADGVPLPAGNTRLQIRVLERHGDVRFEWRDIHTNPRLRQGRSREWSHAEVGSGRCHSGVLELETLAFAGPDSLSDTPKNKRFRLARLEDGALAVGREWVEERSIALFSWGDVHRGHIDLPDRHHWTWSKLRMQVDGDAEPPVMGPPPAP